MAARSSATETSSGGDDERLLIEAAKADPQRFADLYEQNFDRVYAFVARRSGTRGEAEDLTAEVFHQALANRGRFEWRVSRSRPGSSRLLAMRSPTAGSGRRESAESPRRTSARSKEARMPTAAPCSALVATVDTGGNPVLRLADEGSVSGLGSPSAPAAPLSLSSQPSGAGSLRFAPASPALVPR